MTGCRMAEREGTNTPEYKLVRSNFSSVAKGITQALVEFATKAFEKKLVSDSSFSEAKNPHNPEYDRASNLVQLLLRKIEINAGDFYPILEICQSIPALEQVTKILQNPRSKVVRGYYYRLTASFGPVLEKLAAKFNVVGLIDIDSLTNANNVRQPEYDRAKALLDNILVKAESEKKWFDSLVSVMREIPELVALANELETALKIEEDSFNRNVFVIRPPLQRSLSLPVAPNHSRSLPEFTETHVEKESGFCGDRESRSEVAVDRPGQEDSTSLFEFMLPTFLSDNELELIVDTEPTNVTCTQSEPETVPSLASDSEAKQELGVDAKPVSETSRSLVSAASQPGLSNAGVKFTYSKWPTPVSYYESPILEQTSEEESSLSSAKDESVMKRLSDIQFSDVQKVKQLKKQPGIIVSQRENKIADLSRQYGEKNRQVEEVIKSKSEIKKQSEHLKEQHERIAELERRIEDLQNDLHAVRKELRDNQLKKEEGDLKLEEYFEKNYVRKIEDNIKEETSFPSREQESGSTSKLYEKPSHVDVFKAMLKYDLANHWKTIGTLLGLSSGQLHAIENRTTSDEEGLRQMTDKWLSISSKDCNWKSLVSAVKLVDRQKASQIKDKYDLQ